MTSADYKKFLPKKIGKGKSKEGALLESDSSKRRRVDIILGGSSANAEVVMVDAQTPPSSPLPAPPTALQGNLVSLEPGELWRSGVSDRLRAVLKPPPGLISSSGLTSTVRAKLARMEEESLKAISLIQTFQDFNQSLDLSIASNASLTTKVEELSKSGADLEVRVQNLSSDLGKAKKDLETATTKVDELSAERETLMKSNADKDIQLKQLQAEFEEAKAVVARVAIQAFDNAIAQAQTLNPGLVVDGMDVAFEVRDGVIVPGTPDSGSADEGEAEAEMPAASPHAAQ